jgi:hypothetical protein
MKTNDLKKGTEVLLRNGWTATVEDNMRGNTRICTVRGFETEMGSVYSHDIVAVLPSGERIEHTPAQLALKKRVEAMGF